MHSAQFFWRRWDERGEWTWLEWSSAGQSRDRNCAPKNGDTFRCAYVRNGINSIHNCRVSSSITISGTFNNLYSALAKAGFKVVRSELLWCR